MKGGKKDKGQEEDPRFGKKERDWEKGRALGKVERGRI